MSKLVSKLPWMLGGAVAGAIVVSGVPDARPARGPVVESPSNVVAAPSSYSAPLVVKPIEPGNEPIQPVPGVKEFFEDHLEIDFEEAKIELGRRLFHDTRLSSDDTVSCASCHDLRYGGIDRAAAATGVRGQLGPINTPTVFNAAFNVMQFWDGRAEDLEQQAGGPPTAPKEMNSNWEQINSKLLADARIVELARRAYDLPDPIPQDLDESHWLEAIADFERTLITPDAPFDRYLTGDASAVSQEVKEGYQLFKDVGCVECHNGIAVGAKSLQKLGRNTPYFGAHTDPVDLGRFNVTGRDEDRHVFKVPSLRNVATTGPWFHDGSQETLEEAVRSMAVHQLGKTLGDHEVGRISEFLRSLTGTFEGRSLDGGSSQSER